MTMTQPSGCVLAILTHYNFMGVYSLNINQKNKMPKRMFVAD